MVIEEGCMVNGIFGHSMMGGYGFGFGPVFQIIIVVLFLLVILWIFKSNQNVEYKTQKGETAIEILKKRFVSGEITKKEFEAMKKEISN